MIQHELSSDINEIRVYPLGDTQIGSANYNPDLMKGFVNMVKADQNGKVVLVGDMINNGLRASKTNIYRETMPPSKAKQVLRESLEPIWDRIIGAVAGNHELRSASATDDCPLYDVLEKLDLEDFYRENLAFIDLSFGKNKSGKRVNYQLVLGHGTSKNKTEQFSYTIDGMDVLVTGHIHQPYSRFPSKIVIDPHNKRVKNVGFTHIIVPSFDEFGGYVARGMYQPQSSDKTPVIILGGSKKEVEVLWTPIEKYM